MEDTFDLYDDLEEFQQKQEERNKELEAVEEKYQKALVQIQESEAINHSLKKEIKQMEMNFQALLDTARAEIRRKDNEIAELRRLKDDICFRRLKVQASRQDSFEKPVEKPPCRNDEEVSVPKQSISVLNEQQTNVLTESKSKMEVEKEEGKEKQKDICPKRIKEPLIKRAKHSPKRKRSKSRERRHDNRSTPSIRDDRGESRWKQERSNGYYSSQRRDLEGRRSPADRHSRYNRRDHIRNGRS